MKKYVNFKLKNKDAALNKNPHAILADRKRTDDATSIVEMPSAVPFGFQPAVMIGNNNKKGEKKPSAKAAASGKPDSITLSSGSSGPPKSGSSGKSTDSWSKML